MTQTQPAPAALRSRTYEWTDPSIVAAKLGSMSGIDQLRTMIAGDLPAPPIMATLDMEPLEVLGEGTVQVYLTSQEFHYNPLGSMHGGVISALLDTAAGCAVHTTLAPGFGYTSLDLHTRFLRPITVASGRLRCEGIVVNRTRQTALAESRLYDEGGRLVAHATSTCMIFPMPSV
jgi:uncharacterized protein (TIGR00369 family)